MTKNFPDGTVELTASKSTLPPGETGQGGTTSTCWFRINGGEWERASSRAQHKNMQALECADSVAEFRKYLEII